MMNGRTAKKGFVPYPVIVSAANGEPDAINAVLRHYGDYIAVLSTKRLFDKDGNPYSYVDEGIKRRLETKLLSAILKFDAA